MGPQNVKGCRMILKMLDLLLISKGPQRRRISSWNEHSNTVHSTNDEDVDNLYSNNSWIPEWADHVSFNEWEKVEMGVTTLSLLYFFKYWQWKFHWIAILIVTNLISSFCESWKKWIETQMVAKVESIMLILRVTCQCVAMFELVKKIYSEVLTVCQHNGISSCVVSGRECAITVSIALL